MKKLVLIVREGRKGSAGGRNAPLSFYGQEQMLRLKKFVCDQIGPEANLVVFSFSGLARAVESAQILAGENAAIKVYGLSVMERADLELDCWVAELKHALNLVWENIHAGEASLIVIVGHSALPAILAEAFRDTILQTKGVQLDIPERGEGYLVSLDTGAVVPVRQAVI